MQSLPLIFQQEPQLVFLLSRAHVESLFANLLPVCTVCLPSTPQKGNKGTRDNESETRMTETEGSLHYFLATFGSDIWSLPQCTEESSALSQSRKGDIIWWLATTKKCWQIINLL